MKSTQLVSILTSLLIGVLLGPSSSAYAGPSSSLTSYFSLSQALADDSLPAAKKAAKELARSAQSEAKPALEKLAVVVGGSSSLAEAREKFKPVSREAIQEASTQGGYYVMTCSMAKAEWLQETPVLSNPYMGKAMLRCGAIKEQTNPQLKQQ